MQALRLHARGVEHMTFDDNVPAPEPGVGEVRVRVHAAGITPAELSWDETYKHADGTPRLPSIPGHDVSGVVEQLGPGASGWSIGDAVFGLLDFPRDGSAADFVVAPANELASKPAVLDHVHAAAVPLSALTAWQALYEHGQLAAGDRVLIHGAAGGVGAYAVQLARHRGAHVTATASGRHAKLLHELGADTIVDYATTPFETVAHDVAIVLDTIGGETRERSWNTLRPGGRLIALNAPIAPDPRRRTDVTGTFFIVRPNGSELGEIATLIDAGQLRVAIDAVYPLAEGRLAFTHAAAGHRSGKVVLRVR